jgi:uncharacterized paraquat-inducible protein A
MVSDDSFNLTQYRTTHEPELSDFEHRGRVRLVASCACRARLHALSSGQAKLCEHCGLMLARVGDRIHVARVMVGDGL